MGRKKDNLSAEDLRELKIARKRRRRFRRNTVLGIGLLAAASIGGYLAGRGKDS